MRKWLVLLLLAVLTLSGTALAQDAGMPEVFCGGLSDEDCALLEESHTAMAGVTEAAFDLFVDVRVPDEDTGELITFSLVGSGGFAGLTGGGADMMGMPSAADVQELIAKLRDFSGQLTLTLTLPAELASGGPESLTLDVRLVEGFAYLNLDELQPLFGDPEMTGWGGLDLASLLSAIVEEQPEIFSQMGAMAGGVDPSLYGRFSDPEFFGQYMTITRTDDGSGDVATFETRLDLGALMASPEFRELMREQAEAAGEEFDEAELDEAIEMNAQMFQDANFVAYQDIGIDDALIRSTRIEFDFDFAAAMAAAEAMDDDDAGEDDDQDEVMSAPFQVTVMVNLTYEDLPEITAPENAQIVPYESLLQSFGAMMGPGAMGSMDDAGAEALEMTPTPTSAG